MRQDREILDSISTGIVTLDDELRVTALNAAGEALLKTSEARAIGLHAGQLVQQPGAWIRVLEQVLHSNNPLVRRSMPLFLLSGQEIHVDLMITPVVAEEGETTVLVELQAIDRLLKISREEGLLLAQETTRAMIRGLAHEIKNPLGGVRGAAQLLARQLPDKELAEYTRIIIREADRLRDLVDRMLGPHQQPELSQINIHEVLEHVRDLITAESEGRATIARDYDPSLPEFPGDRAQLVQVVLNLMRNALQAAEHVDGCVITLRTRSQRQFTVGGRRHRLVCRIDVIDNGPGIAQELLPSIFAPMVTGRPQGTGLGLSIAQSIVIRHGGLLEYTGEPGQTQFTIYLPMDKHHA